MGKNFSKNNVEGKRREADFYETPYSLTRLFLKDFFIRKGAHILEPACGKGAIMKILAEEGFHHVTGYDLHVPLPDSGMDFFEEENQYDWIITNPPYRDSLKWMLKCKEVARSGFALLLPLTYLHGQARYEQIFNDISYPLTRVYVFTRFAMLGEPLNEDGSFNTGMQAYAWFVWERFHTQMTSFDPTIRWLNNNPYVISKAKPKEDSDVPVQED